MCWPIVFYYHVRQIFAADKETGNLKRDYFDFSYGSFCLQGERKQTEDTESSGSLLPLLPSGFPGYGQCHSHSGWAFLPYLTVSRTPTDTAEVCLTNLPGVSQSAEMKNQEVPSNFQIFTCGPLPVQGPIPVQGWPGGQVGLWGEEQQNHPAGWIHPHTVS